MGRRTLFKTAWTLAAAVALVAAALMLSPATTRAQQTQVRRVDDAVLRNAGTTGEDWLTYGLDPGEKRYSPLTHINATNVTNLRTIWSLDIPGGSNNAPPGGGN